MEKVVQCLAVFGIGMVAAIGLLIGLARSRAMNVKERQAWFMLGVFGLTLAGFFILVGLLRLPWFPATAMLGLYGFAGLAGVIGWGERREGRIITDERDQEIEKAATVAGYSVFWVAFILACMTPFFMKGPHGTVTLPTVILTLPVYIGMLIVFTVRALVTVILYRRGGHGQTA